MKDILLHLAITFIANQGYTLAETPEFLTNREFRERLYPALNKNYPQVRAFWEQFDRRPEREQRELTDSSINKLRRFQVNRTLRGIFGQAANSIDYGAVMDEGKIVLVKLSSQRLGQDNAAFIGAFTVWEILQAALSRSRLHPDKRRQFHLMADEFQTFMSTAFPRLIAECRKYGVDVTVAHQARGQLTQQARDTTLIVGNKIVFSVTGADAEELAKEFTVLHDPPRPTGQKPKYAIVPNPLQHIETHGHEDSSVTSDEKYVAASLNIFQQWAVRKREGLGIFSEKGYSHTHSGSQQLLAIGVERFKRDLNEHLYNAMLIPYEVVPEEGKQQPETYNWKTYAPQFDLENPKNREELTRALDALYSGVVADDVVRALDYIREEWDEWLKDRFIAGRTVQETYYRIAREQGGKAAKRVEDEILRITRTPLFYQPNLEQLMEKNRIGIDDGAWGAAWELHKWEEDLWEYIDRLAFDLWKSPCYSQSGQLESVFDNPRLYSDLQAQIANELATLPRFQAKCALSVKGQQEERTIGIFPSVRLGPEEVLKAPADYIRQRSQTLYGRDQAEVETGIANRIGFASRVGNGTIKGNGYPALSTPGRPSEGDEDLRDEKP